MTSFKPMAALLSLAWPLLPLPVLAASDEVAAMRAELAAMKTDYQSRINDLEARLKQLESAPDASAATAPAAVSQSPGARGSASATAFNPAISLILAGSYTDTSLDPATWHIAGFQPAGGESGPGERSFNLGESELSFSANVDPYFSASMIAAITGEGEIGVEEAYFRTLALPRGFTARGGRFFSGFGYLNEVHGHAWDFIDQPLVYQGFFDGQYAEDGLQLKWLAPTELFVEFGVESGNGQSFPGTRETSNGLNGATVFAHVGGDLGDETSWRAGASWMEKRARNRSFDSFDEFDQPVQDAFTGTSRTWGVDAVLKWAPGGNSARQQIKVQGEYLQRVEDGTLAFDTEGLNLVDDYRSEQSGWYLQGVFQFLPRWRAGIRYDALDSGTPRIGLVSSGLLPAAAFPALRVANPERLALMLDWNPSEFSRLRAQYDLDDARDEGERDRQFRLQYIFGIGAHGAHKY